MRTARSIAVAMLLGVVRASAGTDGDPACGARGLQFLEALTAELQSRGLVGVEGNWDAVSKTYLITGFVRGGQAQAAGLRVGDTMVAINRITFGDDLGAQRDLVNREPGMVVQVTVLRAGRELVVPVKLIAMSSEQIASALGLGAINDDHPASR